MTEDQTIRCNFCGNGYDGNAANCPSCNFPTPGMAAAGTYSNKRIGSDQVVVVGAVAAIAMTLAIVLSVVLMVGEEEPVAQSPAAGASSTRAQAWSSSINGAASSQVALLDALVISTGDNLTRIDADGSDAWITSLDTDADVIAESEDGEYVLTESTGASGVGAYEVASGEQRWFLDGLTYVAAVPGGTLVRAGEGPFGLVDDDGGLAWRVEANEQVALSGASEAAEIVFVRTGTTLTGIDVATGEERWSVEVHFRVGGDPLAMAATNDMVVLGAGGQIVAFDAASGQELWSLDGNGATPAIQQFGHDLVAVGFDADSATTLYDTDGERMSLTGNSRSTLEIITFQVEGRSYAADARNSSVYDATGSRLAAYPEGVFTPSPDGYFVTAPDRAMHFPLGTSSPDYAVPAPAGSVLAPLTDRVLVVAGSNLTGY